MQRYLEGVTMKITTMTGLLVAATALPLFAWGSQKLETGTTISDNKTGVQGDYHVEYWKDGGSGTMTLGEGCNFTCQWGQVNNILFRKGVRPGTKDEVIVYEADYKPQGNSYLSIYGWFQNPLVEYYIIESWGSWKPPGNYSVKGTVKTDSGTYDIYQNSRTGASIEGNKTFQQYWSVRKEKRTKGVITCANHFAAWEKAGMTIGKFYEVSFNVEAYQSPGGQADVKVTIGDRTGSSKKVQRATVFANTTQGKLRITGSSTQAISFNVPKDGFASVKVYNFLGQEVATLGAMNYRAGNHSVSINQSKFAQGLFYYAVHMGK